MFPLTSQLEGGFRLSETPGELKLITITLLHIKRNAVLKEKPKMGMSFLMPLQLIFVDRYWKRQNIIGMKNEFMKYKWI